MTKFILHGGYAGDSTRKDLNFFREILRGVEAPVKILCVYFAREKIKWSRFYRHDKKMFNKANPKIKIKFAIATKNNFIKEAKKAKIIYFEGGINHFLQNYLLSLKNLRNIIKNKVVAGSSAGANIFVKYFFSRHRDQVIKGTGILSIKIICHYNPKKKYIIERLKNYGEDLKIYKIPEYKYIIFKKDF